MSNKYEKGKTTVLLNVSGTVLILPVKTISNRAVSLHPRKGRAFIDIEDACEPGALRAAMEDLQLMVDKRKLKWYAKGARPAAPQVKMRMRLPERMNEGINAPPNAFDKKLMQVIEKEKKQDERTKVSELKRDVPADEEEQGMPSPIAGTAHPQTRFADSAKGEVDAARDVPGGNELTRDTTGVGAYDETSVGELVEAALVANVLTKKGSHIQFGEAQLGNGKKAACEMLEQTPLLLNDLRKAMNELPASTDEGQRAQA